MGIALCEAKYIYLAIAACPNTVECRYNAATFVAMLHLALWWQCQNVSQTLNSPKQPHTLRSWTSSGCLLWEFRRNMTALRYQVTALYHNNIIFSAMSVILWLFSHKIIVVIQTAFYDYIPHIIRTHSIQNASPIQLQPIAAAWRIFASVD